MIHTDNAKWDFSKEEKYALAWFDEHGFDVVLEKQYVSKTIFTVSKDGMSDKFELAQGVKGMKIEKYMGQWLKNWEMYCELIELRKEV